MKDFIFNAPLTVMLGVFTFFSWNPLSPAAPTTPLTSELLKTLQPVSLTDLSLIFELLSTLLLALIGLFLTSRYHERRLLLLSLGIYSLALPLEITSVLLTSRALVLGCS